MRPQPGARLRRVRVLARNRLAWGRVRAASRENRGWSGRHRHQAKLPGGASENNTGTSPDSDDGAGLDLPSAPKAVQNAVEKMAAYRRKSLSIKIKHPENWRTFATPAACGMRCAKTETI